MNTLTETQETKTDTDMQDFSPEVSGNSDINVESLITERFEAIETASRQEAPVLLDMATDTANRLGVTEQDWSTATDLLGKLQHRSNNVCNHCIRVGLLAVSAAEFSNGAQAFEEAVDVGEAFLAGTLHDIGKASVEPGLLEKSIAASKDIPQITWSQADRDQMSVHTEQGAVMAQEAGLPSRVITGIKYHHSLQELAPVYDAADLQDSATRALVYVLAVADSADSIFRDNTSEYSQENASEADILKGIANHAYQKAFPHSNAPEGYVDGLVAQLLTTREDLTTRVQSQVDLLTQVA